MNHKNFYIGDIVKVKAIVEFFSSDGLRYMERKEFKEDQTERIAYYVGYTIRQTGEIKSYTESDEEYGGVGLTHNVLEKIKTYEVARIRFQDRGKEYYALFDDLEFYLSSNIRIAPQFQIKKPQWYMFKERNENEI